MRSACAIAAVAGALGSAWADELWRQDPAALPGGYSSQEARNAGGLGWFSEAADSFTAGADWRVTSVGFWGGYYEAIAPGALIQGAVIRFYADNAGQPGAMLFQQEVAATGEAVHQVALGYPQFRYECALSPPFEAPAAGTYWVSVVALVDRGGTAPPWTPQWGWSTAAGPAAGAPCHQWWFSPGAFAAQEGDLAFVLRGLPCYANCDGSTAAPLLNVADFSCFLTRYAAGESYANCDGSTSEPALNVADFSCFLTRYAQGCP